MKNLFWGCLLIGIGLVNGASIFLGDFGLFNLFFDALGSFWVVKGLWELLGPKQGTGGPLPKGVDPGVAQAARTILANMKESYATPAMLARADAAAFPHLDIARYDALKTALERQGFRWLGDFENVVMNRSAISLLAPTIARFCTSRDGHLVIAYFQVQPHTQRRLKLLLAGLLNLRWIDAPRDFIANRKMRQCVDIETEFDDGSFLVTTNAAQAALLSQPPKVQTDFHAFGTSLPKLLDAHRANLGAILHGGQRSPVAVTTAEAMLNMQKRLASHKLAFRESVQWVTQEELRAMSQGNAKLADAIHAEVRRQLAGEGQRA